MRALWTLFFSLLVSSHFALAKSKDIEEKVDFFCKIVLNHRPFDYNLNFSPDFIKQIPEDYFLDLISDVLSAVGTCNSTSKIEVRGTKATYKFVSASSRYVAIAFSIDANKQIDSLQIKGLVFPDVVIDSWSAAENYAKSWKGQSSISIENFSRKSKINKDGQVLQPLGSGCKLYVLGALTDLVTNGVLRWDQSHPIRNEWKSLPSGTMQNLPEGQQVPLKTFAEYMIKISDNTATDHLINIVGRGVVESQLQVMGNNFEDMNRPFLTTAEMFKIKWASPLDIIDSFIRGGEAKRRNLLENEIAAIPLSRVGKNGVSMENPSFIREIEWFGSTNDLCTAMKSLLEKNSPEVLDILSKNVPFLNLEPDSPWSYGGFKGGSEPGVLTMTYLVRSKNSEWGCISLAWHNESQNVNQWVFFDFTSKVLKLAESYF